MKTVKYRNKIKLKFRLEKVFDHRLRKFDNGGQRPPRNKEILDKGKFVRPLINQKGLSSVEILTVALLLIVIASVAIPVILSSRRNENESGSLTRTNAVEASAAANLRLIHRAQQTYRISSTTDTTYGDFAALSAAGGMLDSTWADWTIIKNTFTYDLRRNAANTKYCVSAVSSDPAARDFGVSSDGVIFQGTHGALTCKDGDLGGPISIFVAN